MAVRAIVLYEHEPHLLRRKSEPVSRFGRKTRRLMQDLRDTLMHHPQGVGLAAPQIGAHRRIIAVQLGAYRSQDEIGHPIVIVNPEILESGNERRDFDGCLSFPGLYAETKRPHFLHIRGLDERGKVFEKSFQGFDAVMVHHEIDHLDGILFIDRVRSMEDLYTLVENERGERVRRPLSATLTSSGEVNQ
jgi:peptide deformylase